MHSLMNVKHFVIGVGRALVFKTELNLPAKSDDDEHNTKPTMILFVKNQNQSMSFRQNLF